MKSKAAFITSVALIASMYVVAPAAAADVPCETPAVAVDAQEPTSFSISGAQVSVDAMDVLWQIVAPSPPTPHRLIGRLIGEDQNWLDRCAYPGIGIGAGSGWNAATKNVTIWIWATGVDVIQARQSILQHIGAVPTTTTTSTTTTSTTTTTLAPTTTTSSTTTSTTASTTTIAPEPETTTTTSPSMLTLPVQPDVPLPAIAIATAAVSVQEPTTFVSASVVQAQAIQLRTPVPVEVVRVVSVNREY